MGSLSKLISLASSSLIVDDPILSNDLNALAGRFADDLLGMLRQRNGFYAFEGALHVLPSCSRGQHVGLDHWNAANVWRHEFADATQGCLFFAEDIFGGQFCIKTDAIFTFDPETGELNKFAKSIENWASVLLDDFEVVTGHVIARKWQERNGSIPFGMRLVPKIPFIFGGEFSLANLHQMESVAAMKSRAQIARQIAGVPDGAQIELDVGK